MVVIFIYFCIISFTQNCKDFFIQVEFDCYNSVCKLVISPFQTNKHKVNIHNDSVYRKLHEEKKRYQLLKSLNLLEISATVLIMA